MSESRFSRGTARFRAWPGAAAPADAIRCRSEGQARAASRALALGIVGLWHLILAGWTFEFHAVDAGPLTAPGRQVLSAAWGDYDGDGRLDLYASALDAGPGQLFRQGSNGFALVTSGPVREAHLRRAAAAWGDYDNDGLPDLAVAGALGDADALYRNRGSEGFAFMGGAISVSGGVGSSCMWADYDHDGRLDFFVVNGGGAQAQESYLYRNQGEAGFVKVTDMELAKEVRYSQGAAFADYDNDGDMDLLVTRSWHEPDSLFRNNGDGTFTRTQSGEVGGTGAPSGGSMPAWADYDNDGDLDLLILAGEVPNRLYRNDGSGTLVRVANGAIASSGGPSAGGVWADFDNDGWLDLLLGLRTGAPLLFRGVGDGAFVAVTDGELPNASQGSNGVAVGDYDADGDLDVYLSNWPSAGPPLLFRNDSSSNAWLRLRLVGLVSNRSGIGAKVRVSSMRGGIVFQQVRQIGGFDAAGSHELVAHFGLGDATSVDVVRVEWPSGIVQEISGVAARQTLVVEEAATPPLTISPNGGTFATSVKVRFLVSMAAAEIRYTTDGTDPTLESPLYREPFEISTRTTVKARLFVNGSALSDVRSATFTPAPDIAFHPTGGRFTNQVDVVLSSRLPGVDMRYTLDGSEPTMASLRYEAPLHFKSGTTVRVRAYFNGFPVTEVWSDRFERVYAFDDEGIPAAWRAAHFGVDYAIDPAAAADADPDGDGSSNRQEFVAGSDPRDPLSGFLLGVRAVPELRFSSVPGRTYRILRRVDVASSVSEAVAELMATHMETRWIDTNAGVMAHPAFYLVQPVP